MLSARNPWAPFVSRIRPMAEANGVPLIVCPYVVSTRPAVVFLGDGTGGVALERGEHVDMGFEIEVPSSEYDDYMEVSDVSSTEKRMCRVTFIRLSMYHSKAFYILYVFKFLVQDLSSMVSFYG